MVNHVLIILLLNTNTMEFKEFKYPMVSAEQCYIEVAKVAVEISGKSALFQTVCTTEEEKPKEEPKTPPKNETEGLFTI